MGLLLCNCLIAFGLAVTFAAPTERNNSDWSFTGFTGQLSGRKGKTSEAKTRSFGEGLFESVSSSNVGLSGGSIDLESFVGVGTINIKNSQNSIPAESANKLAPPPPKKHVIVETESNVQVDAEEGTHAGGVSGVAGGESLETLDLDTFAGVSKKEGFSHSSSRAISNPGSQSGQSKESKGRVVENAPINADLSVAAVGASASVGKDGANKSSSGGSLFGDDFFASSSLSARKSQSNSKLSGRAEGFGSESGNFGIVFGNDEE